MKLLQPLENLLAQLGKVLEELSIDEFTCAIGVLSNSSIGQHTRHILEFFIELNNGYDSGTVDYDQRKRNHTIESDNSFALEQLQLIVSNLSKPNRVLILKADYDCSGHVADEMLDGDITTNYFRELVYNLEHAVHHMALIRIGINEVSTIELPAMFGVACSTLKFRAVCAQ
ncbi:DinB family protein [Pedobacter sp. LMG 31464]|uniref:DinB family protein n=1 Tax=Pedobacter planticolens TaxID=2679964 RepID=A0A923E199_9SPHI|nr:DinB family protein [Pedobacter planticolens]MBB2146845.1 DinB family protein [Pedobacter planticolens]